MRTTREKYGVAILLSLIWMVNACRQSYQPPAVTASRNYLVADGYLNAADDSTIITLTRTRNLTGANASVPEAGATLVVEGSAGYSATLNYLGNGRYGSPDLHLTNTQQYRLNIATSNGSTYRSDYTDVKISPAIDSISWQRGDTGVSIYANTHDPLNNTRYYRWEYTETWEYHSAFESFLHYNPSDTTLTSNAIEVPHICWTNNHSTNILVASSASLSQDIIYRAPLTVIPLDARQISVKYSILVKQYALTPDAYNYWVNLQKTTELTGSVFDQQPSQVTGNLHCLSNPNEPVIGYIGAGAVSEQRIFIDNSQVTPWIYDPGCGTITIHSKDSLAYYENTGGWVAIQTLPPGSYVISGYVISSDYCVDCTVRLGLAAGTNIKPAFWP